MRKPRGKRLVIPARARVQISSKDFRFVGMPHPEAHLHRANHLRWTREELPEEGMGVAFFRNAVHYIRNDLL